MAIGHESDLSLAEMVADSRASTPSNAAELVAPDKVALKGSLILKMDRLCDLAVAPVRASLNKLNEAEKFMSLRLGAILENEKQAISSREQLLAAYNPKEALKRGYAVVRHHGRVVTSMKQVTAGSIINTELGDGVIKSKVL